MRVKLNGEWREFPDGLSVEELLQREQVRREYMALELNRAILRKARYAETVLADGDVIEIVKLVGGG